MISQKLRFEILKRDGFRCQYCGKDGKDDLVMLEVDHIIPKSRGGTDSVDNLITCCRACNMGKGNRSLDISELWKDKKQDTITKTKKAFTKKWNNASLGKIEKQTYILLSKYIEVKFPTQYYMSETYADLFGVDEDSLTYEQCVEEFKKGGEYCDKQLKKAYDYFLDYDLDKLINIVCNDKEWSRGKISTDDGMGDIRLNYLLSRGLIQSNENVFRKKNEDLYFSKKDGLYYFVLKYTYMPSKVPEWFNGLD